MDQLRSEYMSKRLYCTMSIIMISVLCLTIPLVVFNYQNYIQHKETLKEIESLEMMAQLANEISKERAPANKLMSGTATEYKVHAEALVLHRQKLDQALQQTIKSLDQNGFDDVAYYLKTDFTKKLAKGRLGVEQFAALPESQRDAQKMDQAIQGMFLIWDAFHHAIQQLVTSSRAKQSEVANYYTLILLLAEFRDQAGRVASNVMAPVTFQEPMSEKNIARALQNQHQVRYLWSLVNVLIAEHEKTPQFLSLYQNVKTQFLDQTLPRIDILIDQSVHGQPYQISGTGLTNAVVDQFQTVVALQDYLLKHSVKIAKMKTVEAKKTLYLLMLLVLISGSSIVFTLLYARRRIFIPLIRARNMLLELSRRSQAVDSQLPAIAHTIQKEENVSLFTAIQRLKNVLQQRDDLENELKRIANSDSLTGVSNRFALQAYLQVAAAQPDAFQNTCLMLIDIDHFKKVNDQYGHSLGDTVIRTVADHLVKSVRTSDLVVRYGGDEFIVILENIELSAAQRIADELVKEISMTKIQLKKKTGHLNISVSLGMAVGAQDWKTLFEQADLALFRAKEAGRNRAAS